MKRIAIIAALLLAASCSPKIAPTESAATDTDLYDFHRDGNNVSWAKVYYFDAKDEPKVREWFGRTFSAEERGDGKLYGEYHGKLPLEEAGLTWGKTAILLQGETEVVFFAEFREGRVRIVADKITFFDDSKAKPGQRVVANRGFSPTSLNEYAITEGVWRQGFVRTVAAQLQKQLEYLFTPRKSTLSDEW